MLMPNTFISAIFQIDAMSLLPFEILISLEAVVCRLFASEEEKLDMAIVKVSTVDPAFAAFCAAMWCVFS